MGISLAERQELLAEPLVAALSVSADNGRAPLTVPVWYDYTDGELWLHTTRDSVKARLVQAAGRCTLMVNRVQPTVRYASAEGPARVEEATDEHVAHMARRYLAPEMVDSYLASADSHGPQVRIVVTPVHWLSADLGAF